MLAYNLSPSFNWDRCLAQFQLGGEMGGKQASKSFVEA
jgi:isocitrate lyase